MSGESLPDDVFLAEAEQVRELWQRAGESPEVAPMAEVARRWQRLIATLPVDSPFRAESLAYLGDLLRSKYERSGDLADLDAAVTIARQASDTAAPDDESLPGIAYILATALVFRFEATSRSRILTRPSPPTGGRRTRLPPATPTVRTSAATSATRCGCGTRRAVTERTWRPRSPPAARPSRPSRTRACTSPPSRPRC